jgi:hypothetical protein
LVPKAQRCLNFLPHGEAYPGIAPRRPLAPILLSDSLQVDRVATHGSLQVI